MLLSTFSTASSTAHSFSSFSLSCNIVACRYRPPTRPHPVTRLSVVFFRIYVHARGTYARTEAEERPHLVCAHLVPYDDQSSFSLIPRRHHFRGHQVLCSFPLPGRCWGQPAPAVPMGWCLEHLHRYVHCARARFRRSSRSPYQTTPVSPPRRLTRRARPRSRR